MNDNFLYLLLSTRWHVILKSRGRPAVSSWASWKRKSKRSGGFVRSRWKRLIICTTAKDLSKLSPRSLISIFIAESIFPFPHPPHPSHRSLMSLNSTRCPIFARKFRLLSSFCFEQCSNLGSMEEFIEVYFRIELRQVLFPLALNKS